MFVSYFAESIISRAIENKIIDVKTYALREYTTDKHRRVDGRPYAGGPGMVMWVDPIMNCVDTIKKSIEKRSSYAKASVGQAKSKTKIVIFSPGGEDFDTSLAKKTAKAYSDIIFICGRYEGIDARVKKILKASEWSIGNYVLTGGELPAMVCVDSISRQVAGVLHDNDSLEENRISSHETYARPEIYEYAGKKYRVPKVLLSGNHKLIEEWKVETKLKLPKLKKVS
jgi:tRNA (guanine37-N1)-methyltransferase